MSKNKYAACVRAASDFVRNQPTLFVDAAQWVVSQEQGSDDLTEAGGSAAYRTVEAVIAHYRSLLDKQPQPTVETAHAAYCAILTSWLLADEAHEPLSKAGGIHDTLDRPPCLQQLPVLSSREFMRLTEKYRHQFNPLWHDLVFAAWEVVEDPGYRPTRTNDRAEEQSRAARSPAEGAEHRKPLSDQGRAMYDVLCALPEVEGRTGKQLAKELQPLFPGMDEDRIRRLAQQLKPYGLRSHGSAGYYIPLSLRPKLEDT